MQNAYLRHVNISCLLIKFKLHANVQAINE